MSSFIQCLWPQWIRDSNWLDCDEVRDDTKCSAQATLKQFMCVFNDAFLNLNILKDKLSWDCWKHGNISTLRSSEGKVQKWQHKTLLIHEVWRQIWIMMLSSAPDITNLNIMADSIGYCILFFRHVHTSRCDIWTSLEANYGPVFNLHRYDVH